MRLCKAVNDNVPPLNGVDHRQSRGVQPAPALVVLMDLHCIEIGELLR